ncbi:hypothetical protein MHIB_04810 [Mycolicibacter hiberniae]|uniref:Uncharacterized protein n=1 Tax=Mycolicibacter hiberniae TaxID=29314 RepID=A0A7I7WZU1_9MYCO|nr:hypothetical protein MHIB_04810 [Mycolicibacter hiberniae]
MGAAAAAFSAVITEPTFCKLPATSASTSGCVVTYDMCALPLTAVRKGTALRTLGLRRTELRRTKVSTSPFNERAGTRTGPKRTASSICSGPDKRGKFPRNVAGSVNPADVPWVILRPGRAGALEYSVTLKKSVPVLGQSGNNTRASQPATAVAAYDRRDDFAATVRAMKG